MRTFRRFAELAATVIVLAAPMAPRALNEGEYGEIFLVAGPLLPPSEASRVADLAVDPRGDFAYLADPGTQACGPRAAEPRVWIVDINDLSAPQYTGSISFPDPGQVIEGIQAVQLSTPFFDGTVLVTAGEPCGTGGGGISLFDVTDPLKPVPLSLRFGDRTGRPSPTRSAFAWDVGDRAYLAAVRTVGSAVDVFDITNPRRPERIVSFDVAELGGPIAEPEPLTDSSPRDVFVRNVNVGGEPAWVLLVSHGDGGFALLNVDDPADPRFIGDTDYGAVDQLLLERTGIEKTPEGNAHYAEFTSNGRFFIGADEDLDPYDTDGDFNGWGYVHLFDTQLQREWSAFAIEEAHDSAFAKGFGSLSVHEVATHPTDPSRVYLSYHAGGLVALAIQCVDQDDPSTCELLEVGGFDSSGNDFFGIETFVREDDGTIILTSDRDGGLWIFRAN